MKFKTKSIVLVLALVALIGAAGAYFQADPRAAFADAYWAAQPPEERALRGMESFSPERAAKAVELAQKGNTIDPWIEAIGAGNPLDTMKLRSYYDYTWVPSLLQDPVLLAPGLSMPTDITARLNLKPYDAAHPPAGSIRVSANISDYPPFDPPKPTTVSGDQPVVGSRNVGELYYPGPGDTDAIPSGAIFTDSRGTFEKVLVSSPFGGSRYWKKVK